MVPKNDIWKYKIATGEWYWEGGSKDVYEFSAVGPSPLAWHSHASHESRLYIYGGLDSQLAGEFGH